LARDPFLAQALADQPKGVLGEMGVPPGSATAGSRAPLCLAGSVGTVGDVTAVSLQLPVNGASMAPEALGNLGHTEPLHSELTNAYPVLQGELRVNSHRCSLFGRKEKRLFSQLALLNSESVALSI
jgi:hypothetical protein